MRFTFSLFLILLTLSFLIGCENKNSTITAPPQLPTEGTFTSSNVKDAAVFFNLETGKESPQWDIKFGEFTQTGSPYAVPGFVLNYSRFGNEYVQIINTNDTSMNAIVQPTSLTTSRDLDTAVAGGWYNYNVTTHTLSSKGFVYVVKTADGNFFKFKITYYSNKVFNISYNPYRKRDGVWLGMKDTVIDISSGVKYFNCLKGLVTPANWDIQLTTLKYDTIPYPYPGIVLNREKNVNAKVVDAAYNTIDPLTVTGLQSDTDNYYAIGINCFYYNGTSHKLTPYDNRTFVLKTANGKFAKMKMNSYYDPITNASGYFTIEYLVK